MAQTLTNLIPVPGMEGSGWTGSYSTDHAMEGTRSLKLVGTASTPEVCANTTGSISLIPGHIYYARVYGWQDARTNATVGFYWPIAEPSFQEGIPIGPAGQWNLYSGRTNRASFAAGSYQLRLDFNNSGLPGTMYFDGAMLLDLTAAFGAGNEPSQAACDRSIPYFSGTKTWTHTMTAPQITGAAISPLPASINKAVTLQVTVEDMLRLLEPSVWHAGEFYSGEV